MTRTHRPLLSTVLGLSGAAALLATGAAPASAAALRSTPKTRPDLKPPLVRILKREPGIGQDPILITPRAAAPSQRTGPLIIDNYGRARFYHITPKGQSANGLRVQTYQGKPVLTWAERPPITSAGGIYGGDKRKMFNAIMDQHYKVLRKVQAKGTGVFTDLHDFVITPQNTALVLGYRFVTRDLRKYGFSQRAKVIDCLVQEIDLKTGKVLLNWSSVDHVPLSDSVVKPTPHQAWDYFHVNSVGVDVDGQLIVSARHTSTVYKIGRRKGQVLWRLGGKRSSYKLGGGVRTWYQHDAELRPDGTLSIFDNNAADFDKSHGKTSHVLRIKLDRKNRVASLASSITHPRGVLAVSQGNAQLLSNGDTFVGWGSSPTISEFSPSNKLLFDIQVPTGRYQSYRAFRQAWHGTPTALPKAAATAKGSALVGLRQLERLDRDQDLARARREHEDVARRPDVARVERDRDPDQNDERGQVRGRAGARRLREGPLDLQPGRGLALAPSDHQPQVPGPPLNGPRTWDVIQPP